MLVAALAFAGPCLPQESSSDYWTGFRYGAALVEAAQDETKPEAPDMASLASPDEWIEGREDGIAYGICLLERLLASLQEHDEITSGEALSESSEGYRTKIVDGALERAQRECLLAHFSPGKE